jgi:hypothetical protein
MVAANATAIRIDINCSSFARSAPVGALKFAQTGKTPDCRLAHAFLIACLNRMVSAPDGRQVSMRGTKEMFELK